MALPLFELLRRGRRAPLTLVVSLDGSRAGAALLDRSGKKPTVRFSSEIELAEGVTPAAPALLAALLEKLALALAAAKDQGLRVGAENGAPSAVTEAVAFIGAPWCDTAIKKLCLAKETPMTLTQKTLDRVFERNDFALKLNGELDEKVLARAAANGYPVANPVGLRARLFELTVFLAAIEPAVRGGVQNAIATAFPGVKTSFASQSRALFDVARGIFPHEGRTLVLDIGGELTEAVRIDGDDLGAVGSTPTGTLSAVRDVAARCDLQMASAASALRAQAESGDADCTGAVGAAVTEATKAWGAAIAPILADVSGGEPASRIVIAADAKSSASAASAIATLVPGAEIVILSTRNLEPLIAADPSVHPTTVACALAVHSRANLGR